MATDSQDRTQAQWLCELCHWQLFLGRPTGSSIIVFFLIKTFNKIIWDFFREGVIEHYFKKRVQQQFKQLISLQFLFFPYR